MSYIKKLRTVIQFEPNPLQSFCSYNEKHLFQRKKEIQVQVLAEADFWVNWLNKNTIKIN